MSGSKPSQGRDMPANVVDRPSGTSDASTSQPPSTPRRSTKRKLGSKIKDFLSGSRTPSARPTTPTPQPVQTSDTIERQDLRTETGDELGSGKLTSKRAEKVPEDGSEANHKKIVLLDLGIGAINALRDVSNVTGNVTNQPNPVGPILERVTAVLGTLKQMMENRSAWETLLLTLDGHQRVFNQQLALLKKDQWNEDPTSPFLGPIKQYSTALEEILAGVIKESGLADRDSPDGGRWETVKKFSSGFVSAASEKDQIQAYDRKVSDAMNHLHLALGLFMSDALQEVKNKFASNEEENMLAKLKIAGLDCGSPLRGCMEGTRQDILEKIKEWTMDLDGPNILWLKGHPGVGKSAIATNVVEYLRASKCLGSSFFFHRQNATIMTTSLLWCVVAYDLAGKYPTIRKGIIAALKEHELGPTTVNVDKLFLHLICEPMIQSEAGTENASPIVVVVDALDECGGLDSRRREHRRSLMQTLKKWSHLPTKFKLVVTSRGESDIERVFSSTDHRLIEILAGQAVEPQSLKDIRLFLRYQLQVQVLNEYEELFPPDYGTQVVEDLAERAAGLFIWAETVINYIGVGQPQMRLEKVLKGSATGDMNALYSEILRSSFGQADEAEIGNFCAVVGAIILAKVPLSVFSLQQLLCLDELTVRHICNGLRSVLDPGDTLRFHHQSFVDFLMDPKRSPHQFRFQRNRESRNLTLACLRVMKSKLRFNICNLGSSYLCNADTPELESRVEQYVPPYVSYSSRFWANHLAETVFDTEIFDGLQYFMQKQFLFWLEILSLIKQVNIASSALLILVDWINGGQQDNEMARDMHKFVSAFSSVISQSVPHIYLSALPFSPRNSMVSKQYGPDFPRTITTRTGGLAHWPALLNVLSGHSQWVSPVAFSPDGRHIASGSGDKTIRVWDAETGEMVAGPLNAHSDSVNSVAFSPDGTWIVSGSADHTIRVWDAETGEVVAGPFKGHESWVMSVAFSPDGTWIVSGSGDDTIRVWDARTGEVVLGPLKAHSDFVTSVAFSPDGKRIVSGSRDATIRIWNAETGEMVGGPFEGHSKGVRSVAFSPDGTRVASGSDDLMIRVWDVKTGGVVLGPLGASSAAIGSVAFAETGELKAGPSMWDAGGPFKFSPDGSRVVSGSDDGMVRVWDAETGRLNMGRFGGHIRNVTSVGFSPDGTRIVSGSWDNTIRVWDAETGEEVVAGSFIGHEGWISCVSFSSDGTRIVSGSRDHTICVWDARTGEVVLGPLRAHQNSVSSVTISSGGKRIVSGSWDNTIRVWDAETGEVVGGPFEGHSKGVESVAFSPDGTRIVSGSHDMTIRVWDAETGEVVGGPFEGHSKGVESVAFSPDGTRIVSGSYDMTIRVWDVKTGEVVLGPLEGHRDRVASVAFSPDGRHIASGSADKTIRVWDADTGMMVAGPYEAHNNVDKTDGYFDGVNSVAFSPDGTCVLSGSTDQTIRMWDFRIGKPRFSNSDLIPIPNNPKICDGWILGPNSELLFWVPPALREGLLWPNDRLLIGRFIKTRLDLALFVHGESWSQCKG